MQHFTFVLLSLAIPFALQKNCLSWHGIQNPRKTPLFCLRIASNVSDVHLYHRGKNKRSTMP